MLELSPKKQQNMNEKLNHINAIVDAFAYFQISPGFVSKLWLNNQ
jgi:hypothetical protein